VGGGNPDCFGINTNSSEIHRCCSNPGQERQPEDGCFAEWPQGAKPATFNVCCTPGIRYGCSAFFCLLIFCPAVDRFGTILWPVLELPLEPSHHTHTHYSPLTNRVVAKPLCRSACLQFSATCSEFITNDPVLTQLLGSSIDCDITTAADLNTLDGGVVNDFFVECSCLLLDHMFLVVRLVLMDGNFISVLYGFFSRVDFLF
jgi:hypothetical protein